MPPADLLLAPPGGMLVNASLSDVQTLRDIARSLLTRAMWHLGAGRTEAAWRDIHAMHRLSRLMAPPGRGLFVVTHLVSVAIGAVANAATLDVLQSPDLSPDEAAAIRRDLDALPARAGAADSVAIEQLVALDVVMKLAAMNRAERSRTLSSNLLMDSPEWRLQTSIDFNVALRDLNDCHDRVAAAAQLPDRAARGLAFDAIDGDIASAARAPSGWRRVAWLLRSATNRQARSADVGAGLVNTLRAGWSTIFDMDDRARAEFDLLCVAAAIAEYRLRGLGGPDRPCPERLEALVPDVLAEVPHDPFTGGPLAYERRGDGYLLYAVGTNGVDDGGTSGDIVKGEWQAPDPFARSAEHGLDNVLRLPTPRRRPLPEANP